MICYGTLYKVCLVSSICPIAVAIGNATITGDTTVKDVSSIFVTAERLAPTSKRLG